MKIRQNLQLNHAFQGSGSKHFRILKGPVTDSHQKHKISQTYTCSQRTPFCHDGISKVHLSQVEAQPQSSIRAIVTLGLFTPEHRAPSANINYSICHPHRSTVFSMRLSVRSVYTNDARHNFFSLFVAPRAGVSVAGCHNSQIPTLPPSKNPHKALKGIPQTTTVCFTTASFIQALISPESPQNARPSE